MEFGLPYSRLLNRNVMLLNIVTGQPQPEADYGRPM